MMNSNRQFSLREWWAGFREQWPDIRERCAECLNETFPERQIVVRTEERVSYLRITKKPQMAIAASLIAFSGWIGFTGVSYFLNDQIIASKNSQIVNARLAYQSLLSEVGEYQNKFIGITTDLEENHSLMLGLVEQNASLQQDLSTIEHQLKVTEADRQAIFGARERLKGDLDNIQDNLTSITSRNFLLQDNLDTVASNLSSALSERNSALVESKHMKLYSEELKASLDSLQTAQIGTVEDLTQRTDDNIESMERVVQMAGLDINAVLKANPDKAGQGGPFIEVPDGVAGDELRTMLVNLDSRLEHLKILQDSMQRIPLAAPLKTYYITSKYGKRLDPVNEKWSMHYGVDMGSTGGALAYSTAPGVVSYAGWKGKYGKFIEIDHGGGIKTRFGHLDKIFVKKGQKIGFFEKIGKVGSTGRSTGPHLHYEITFAKKPMDPMSFIKAGYYVFQE